MSDKSMVTTPLNNNEDVFDSDAYSICSNAASMVVDDWWVINDIFKPRVEDQRLLPSKHYAFHNVRTMLVQRRRQWVFVPTLL